MISDQLHHAPTTSGPRLQGFRLALKPTGSMPGCVDGGWWPLSGDLATQLPELVSSLAPWVGPVSRVSYHLDTWETAPAKVLTRGRTIRVEGFRSIEPNTVVVIGVDSRRVTLLVVPHHVPGGAARAVLRAAAGHDSTSTAVDILVSNGITPSIRRDAGTLPDLGVVSAAERRWEADGGRTRDDG